MFTNGRGHAQMFPGENLGTSMFLFSSKPCHLAFSFHIPALLVSALPAPVSCPLLPFHLPLPTSDSSHFSSLGHAVIFIPFRNSIPLPLLRCPHLLSVNFWLFTPQILPFFDCCRGPGKHVLQHILGLFSCGCVLPPVRCGSVLSPDRCRGHSDRSLFSSFLFSLLLTKKLIEVPPFFKDISTVKCSL